MRLGSSTRQEITYELRASLNRPDRMRSNSKVMISDQVEMWEIPLDSEGAAPRKTIQALKVEQVPLKVEQVPSRGPSVAKNAQDASGCCHAGLKIAFRFVFFGC